MRISDWSSDVCSSDLLAELVRLHRATITRCAMDENVGLRPLGCLVQNLAATPARIDGLAAKQCVAVGRSEEHTSELQSLMRISYAVFCLKKKKINKKITEHQD